MKLKKKNFVTFISVVVYESGFKIFFFVGMTTITVFVYCLASDIVFQNDFLHKPPFFWNLAESWGAIPLMLYLG